MIKQLLFFVLFGLSITSAKAQLGYNNRAAIIEVIQEAYVDGFYNDGYIRAVELAIANDFTSIGVNTEKQTETKNVAEYLADVKKYQAEGKLPLPEEERVTVKYLKIDISGNAAQVKLQFYQNKKLQHIDFLSLYKFDEGWKILNLMHTPAEPH